MHPKNRFCSGMKMGNKSYFTYKRAEQEEILKKSQALVYITEASLGAEKGSFDYIMHPYEETEKG